MLFLCFGFAFFLFLADDVVNYLARGIIHLLAYVVNIYGGNR